MDVLQLALDCFLCDKEKAKVVAGMPLEKRILSEHKMVICKITV